MQTIHKRFSVVTGFVLLVILLLASTWVIRRQLGLQAENEDWVVHTQQVMLELTQTESLIKDAETGQRGFLYTENPQYLLPYDAAREQVGPHLDDLARLTQDSPQQQARVQQLRTLTEQKLNELGQTIALYQAGKPQDARALVLSNQGLYLMRGIRRVTNEMQTHETELEAARSSKYQKSLRVTVACLYLGTFAAVLGLGLLAFHILREIRLRERQSKVLAEREEWFRTTLTSLGDAVIATDGQGRVTFLNRIAEEMMGTTLAEAEHQMIESVFPIFNESTLQPVENPVKKVMECGRVVGLANHTVLRRRDGTYVAIEDSAAPLRDAKGDLAGVVLVFRDATYERRAQELMRKTEKLNAAARLSATVAHEINNPLEAIGNLIYLTKSIDGIPPAAAEHLAMAEQEVERISHITRQTLGFYRESKSPHEIEIEPLVESVLRIYDNKLASKNITVQREFGVCPPLTGLAGELTQAVANLVSNAADAAPEGGTIIVRINCTEQANRSLIQVTVEDDGHGIAPEHQEKIFEPFFTTKADVGTGLGLWVTKEIVDRHGGTIHVSSKQDSGKRGTVFRISLPVAGTVNTLVQ